jgi:hypothetical protein
LGGDAGGATTFSPPEYTRGRPMNITKIFVFVHMPKTGGTFVAHVLREIYMPKWIPTLFLRRVYFRTSNEIIRRFGFDAPHVELDKHAACREIPTQFGHLPIVSCMRNPFDWYVSNYKFQHWKRDPGYYPDLFEDPKWPDIDFEHFMYLSNHQWTHTLNPGLAINPRWGRLTTLFIYYYCRVPERLLTLIASEDELLNAIMEDMFPVTFFDTHQLNSDLYKFLFQQGYSVNELEFIKSLPPIGPAGARKPEDEWENFYTPALLQEVLERDFILFRLFPWYLGS